MTNAAALYQLLDNLLNLHTALLTLAGQKKNVLVGGDIDELVRITQQEQKLIKMIGSAEASRIELVTNIYAEKGLPPNDGSLAELIKLVTSAEEKTRLTGYRDELIRIVTELRDANDLNQQLLEQSLYFVNMSLDLFTDAPEEDFFYKKPTNSDVYRNNNRSVINKKA